MNRFLSRIKYDFFRMAPVVLFFFITFTLVDITELMAHKKMATFYCHLSVVAFASLVMGKVVLLSDRLPIIDLYSKKPLIYSTLWKTAIYLLVSIVVRFSDRLLPYLFEEVSWATTSDKVTSEMERLPFWLSQAWVALLFFVFVAYQELIRAVGEEKVRKLFFGK
ncbi:MAG: hypothetical protein JWO53_863 [Chlamydiia bacterium]|nr:hypothetical protein [Chlamydiia bacterium]